MATSTYAPSDEPHRFSSPALKAAWSGAIAASCCLAACGSNGHSAAKRSGASPAVSANAPVVSSNPGARQVDAQCTSIMPDIRAAVRDALTGAVDPATASRVVSELQTLDAEVGAERGAFTGFGGHWRPALEDLLATFQYAAYGGGSANSQMLASDIVRSSHDVSGEAAAAQIPDCASDPSHSGSVSKPSPVNPSGNNGSAGNGGANSGTTASSASVPSATSSGVTTPATAQSCSSSHTAYFACATPAAPYCEQGQCSYRAPASGSCAPGYRRTRVPSTPPTYVCEKPL